ncbi:MAG: GGDEF domain-containing protein [Burkholderiales bacterium PBB4]|nr:MAG: GGDEF domain-containing protein [Burkholderiales bacterium PBB4]
MKLNWPPSQWGLTSRIVALSMLLLLLVQTAVFSVVRSSIDESAQRQVQQELAIGEKVWGRLLDQNAQQLSQGATVLAKDFAFRDAVNSQDQETIRDALENHGARINATISAYLDTSMKVLAVGGGQDAAQIKLLLTRLAGASAQQMQGNQIAVVGNTPYQFVMVPLKAPVVVGWVLMGFPIDQKLLDDMRALSDMHLVLISQAPGAASQVVSTTLPPLTLQSLSSLDDMVSQVQVPGDVLIARTVKLDAGPSGNVRTLLLRSLNEVVAPFRQAQVALAWITALGVVLFALGSVFAARRVTTPLRSLVSAAETMGRGRYDVPMEFTERKDEIGGLAMAFDAMRINIGLQQDQIRQLAYWDRLTGLPNRAQFREAVQAHMHKFAQSDGSAAEKNMAIIMLDMDRFKHVNDVLGYSFGDQLLIAVAKRLTQREMRTGDMVARLGGDEFAVILSGSDADTAIAVAQRIAKSFEVPLALEDQNVDMSASMGIACYPQHAVEVDALLSRAEVAMYAAKARTTLLQVYDPSLDSASTQTLSMLSELRQAVSHGELRLFLQPKIALASNKVVAAEALVRWQHPERGLVPPLQFIPFAEQTGFVRELTNWVFRETARLYESFDSGSGHLRVAINLSTRDLLDVEFPARLDSMLAEFGVDPAAFCLEITESAIMDDPQRAQQTLHTLSRRGFKLSIDDFGTGYSSLAYLKSLPVDELKIDKSFVMNMESDENDAKIVRSTIDLAHNLGLTVVAEGVENALIWVKLKELQCDEAQGYYMSKPVPAQEFSVWCSNWNSRHPVLQS